MPSTDECTAMSCRSPAVVPDSIAMFAKDSQTVPSDGTGLLSNTAVCVYKVVGVAFALVQSYWASGNMGTSHSLSKSLHYMGLVCM